MTIEFGHMTVFRESMKKKSYWKETIPENRRIVILHVTSKHFLYSQAQTAHYMSMPEPIGFPGFANGKESACQCKRQETPVQPRSNLTCVRSLGWEDPLKEEIATHSDILAWETPWTWEPGGLQVIGSQS